MKHRARAAREEAAIADVVDRDQAWVETRCCITRSSSHGNWDGRSRRMPRPGMRLKGQLQASGVPRLAGLLGREWDEDELYVQEERRASMLVTMIRNQP